MLEKEIEVYKNDSKTLLVWFGGINEPFISNKLGELCKVDVIAVTDKFQSWYTKGFSDSHLECQDAIDQLSQLFSDGAYEKLVLCGQSSGGYAALKFAHALNPDLVITFSPQTKNVYSGQNYMCPHVKIDDLGDLFKDYTKSKLIFVLARSEADHEQIFRWDDWGQISKFRNHSMATFIDLPYHTHSVSLKIKEEMNLYKFVLGLLTMFDVVE